MELPDEVPPYGQCLLIRELRAHTSEGLSRGGAIVGWWVGDINEAEFGRGG